jgi:hypothetical protein
VITRSIGFALATTLILACTPKGDDTDKPKDDTKDDGGKQEEPAPKIETIENKGWACISGAAEQAHTIEVDFGTCQSSSCDRVQSASCTVSQSGTELSVDAKVEMSRGQGTCTDDCRRVTTSCEMNTLAAGSYTLVYAGKRQDITVPLSEAACTEQQR